MNFRKNLLKLAVVSAFVLTGATALLPGSSSAATACDAKGVGSHIFTSNANNSAYTISNGKVTVKFNVTGKNCHLPVSIFSFEAPNPTDGKPYNKQKLLDHTTGYFAAGVHTLTAKIPNCYFQVDTVTGTVMNTGHNDLKERMVAYMHGGAQKCGQIPTPPKTPNYTITKLVSVKGENKFAHQVSVKPGTHVQYLVTVKSTGNTPVTNVNVKDALPTGATYVKSTLTRDGKAISDASFFTSGYVISSLTNGQTTTFMFEAVIGTSDTAMQCSNQTIDNVADIASKGLQTKKADAVVDKTCAPKPMLACNSLQATAGTNPREFTFNASATATNTAITSYDFNFGEGNPVNVPATANTASVTHTYPVLSTAKTYTATVKVNGQDAQNVTSPYCTVQVTVPPVLNPGVTIVKTVDHQKQELVKVGQSYEYEVTVTNNGQVDLTNAVVTDTPPAGVTLLTADKGTIANNAWTYTIPALKVNESQTFVMTAKVDTFTANALVNKACVNAMEVNPTKPADQDACDTATVTVTPPVVTSPGITIQKFVGDNNAHSMQVNVGDVYNYHVLVKNTGDVNLTNAVVTDTPPAGVTLLTADKGTIANNVWTYTIPALAAGDSAEFTLTAKVPTAMDGVLVNQACVNAAEINSDNPTKQDACDTASVTVPTPETPSTPQTPTSLVNTGPGQVIGMFAAATIFGTLAAHVLRNRRFSNGN